MPLPLALLACPGSQLPAPSLEAGGSCHKSLPATMVERKTVGSVDWRCGGTALHALHALHALDSTLATGATIIANCQLPAGQAAARVQITATHQRVEPGESKPGR
ncbi:hypothetical protein IWX90DRAFT_417545 [Phyllosticta citrichinensis]|uniref:Uncharacterized protein n=1 Tax=Phyllosticta citrichinensis TaxID=1130410 RepID=A0ABR1XL98_9PEZI